MPFMRNLSDRVWEYVSPRKTQQRREKPFKVPEMPLRPKLVERPSPEFSLQSKLDRWEAKALASSVDAALLPPSPPTSLHRGVDLDGDTLLYGLDLDGSTLIHDSVEGSASDQGADAWDANDGTMVVDDGQYMNLRKPLDRTKEQLRQEIQCRELRQAGWSEDAVFIFQKLNMRGFEPLLPDAWVNDFGSLPLDLFTPNDNKAFIKADAGSDFRAQYALHQLFALGGLARDAVLTNAPRRTPEYHIIQAVNKYSRWAMQDGGMRHTYNNLSLFTTVACGKNKPTSRCEQKMISRLYKLHQRWAESFQTHDKTGLVAAPEELPTLYGVIASHTVMAFVSYVSPTESNPKGSLRTIAIFDFGAEGFDVWNSFAIAIFAIHCRNRMQQLKEFLPEPVVVPQHDPDL